MSTRREALAMLPALLTPLLATPAARASSGAPEPVEVSQRAIELSSRSAQPTVSSKTPFAMVGLRWDGQPPEVMAVRVPGGEWTAMEPAPGTTASQPVWTGRTHEVQVRATRDGAPAIGVAAVLIDPGRSPSDAVPPTSRDRGYPVVSRAGWGADESLRCREAQFDDEVRAVALHHTAETNDYSASDSPAIVRGIYAYHAETLGWCDIGYHALVDRFGQVFEGRAGGLERPVIGAHSAGFNRRTSSIAMMGSYTGHQAGDAQRDALSGYLGWKLAAHGLDPTGETTLLSEGGGSSRHPSGTEVRLPVLLGHRDVGHTECPGDDGYALLPGLRSAAAATMSAVR
ncbi:MAG: hypothetical protein GEU83_08980 [Pseudonocardiaceae bacterium]|nr:hypothetical protein [Pseudonocardiaceae bacterium]